MRCSRRSIVHVATTPASPQKRGLHCSKCFTTANMWCAQCAAAFCSVCWGQVRAPIECITILRYQIPSYLLFLLQHILVFYCA